MNCAKKLLEPTIFFNLYTKSPLVEQKKVVKSRLFKVEPLPSVKWKAIA